MLSASKPIGSTVQLDFAGGGVGVTFGEPLDIPLGFFDTKLDQLITPAPTMEYDPKDTPGFTPAE